MKIEKRKLRIITTSWFHNMEKFISLMKQSYNTSLKSWYIFQSSKGIEEYFLFSIFSEMSLKLGKISVSYRKCSNSGNIQFQTFRNFISFIFSLIVGKCFTSLCISMKLWNPPKIWLFHEIIKIILFISYKFMTTLYPIVKIKNSIKKSK